MQNDSEQTSSTSYRPKAFATPFFGGKPISPGTITLAFEEISTIRFSRGIIEDKIVIQTTGLEAASRFPLPKNGAVTLYTAKKDRELASNFVAEIHSKIAAPNSLTSPDKSEDKFSLGWQVSEIEKITTKERLKIGRIGLLWGGVAYLLAFVVILGINANGIIRDVQKHGSDSSSLEKPFKSSSSGMNDGKSTNKESETTWPSSDDTVSNTSSSIPTGSTTKARVETNWWIVIYSLTMSLILGVGSIVTSLQLNQFQNYHFCMMASLLMLFGCWFMFANILVAPFLIWTIVVLAFEMTRRVFHAENIVRLTTKPKL